MGHFLICVLSHKKGVRMKRITILILGIIIAETIVTSHLYKSMTNFSEMVVQQDERKDELIKVINIEEDVQTVPVTTDILEMPLEEPLKEEPLNTPPIEVNTYPNLNIPLDDKYKQFIYDLCDQDKELYCFMVSVIKCESNFKADAVSADGHDHGFMQLRDYYYDEFCEDYHISNPKEPYDNLTAGISMLKGYIDKYEHKNLALMCYNMGETGAKRLWKQGIYSTKYTVKVLNVYEEYLREGEE